MSQTSGLAENKVQTQANETYLNQLRAAEKFGLPEFDAALIQDPNGSFKVIEEQAYISGSEKVATEDYTFLASVAKPLIVKVFLDNLRDDFRIPNIELLISEIKGRKQTRYLFTSVILKKYVKNLFTEIALHWTDYSDGIAVKPEDTQELEKEENFDRLLQLISSDFAHWDQKTHVDLLLDLTLKLSCNYPVGMMRNYLLAKVDNDVDEMHRLLKREAESFEILVTFNNNQHWIQDRPNTARFSEIVEVQERLVRGSRNEILAPMTNNIDSFPEPFFDFTGSELGKELIAKGYKIVEKTGSYEVVNWIKDLSNRLPVFMQMVSVVTIIDSEGKSSPTFGYSQTIGLPSLPESMIEEEGGVMFHAPNDKYDEYAERVKKISMPKLRNRLEELGKQIILQSE